MRRRLTFFIIFTVLAVTGSAESLTVEIFEVAQEQGYVSMGTVTFADGDYGLMITPNITGLEIGNHGFHLHQTPSCINFGLAAQGHVDPQQTGKHLGPYQGGGHQGDLPLLAADHTGRARTPLLAPQLKVADLKGHALIIHRGGDNYSDSPLPLGGGGDRVGCGVVESSRK